VVAQFIFAYLNLVREILRLIPYALSCMKILLKRLLLVTPAQYIVFSLWINLLDFVDKEGVTSLHPRCSRKRAMSEIGVDKIESMGREALIFFSGKSYLLSQFIRERAYLSPVLYWSSKFSAAGIVCPVHHSKSAKIIKQEQEKL